MLLATSLLGVLFLDNCEAGSLEFCPDHLSQIETGEEPTNIKDELPDANLFRVDMEDVHYAPIIQFLATGVPPEEISMIQKKK